MKAALNRAELLVDYLGRAREGEEICDRLLKRPLDLFDAADAYFVKTKAALNAGDLPRAFSMVTAVVFPRPIASGSAGKCTTR